MYSLVKPVFDYNVRLLCTEPYYNHPKGCPNFNKRPLCPPLRRRFEDLIDLNKSMYAIWIIFPFGEHREKMLRLHPEWSKRQAECCLYWQGTARKRLKHEIYRFSAEKYKNTGVITCPEATGINVTATMKSLGVELEWPPKDFTCHVAIAGMLKII